MPQVSVIGPNFEARLVGRALRRDAPEVHSRLAMVEVVAGQVLHEGEHPQRDVDQQHAQAPANERQGEGQALLVGRVGAAEEASPAQRAVVQEARQAVLVAGEPEVLGDVLIHDEYWVRMKIGNR